MSKLRGHDVKPNIPSGKMRHLKAQQVKFRGIYKTQMCIFIFQ